MQKGIKGCAYCSCDETRLIIKDTTEYNEDGMVVTKNTQYKIICRMCHCGTPWMQSKLDAINTWNLRVARDYPDSFENVDVYEPGCSGCKYENSNICEDCSFNRKE